MAILLTKDYQEISRIYLTYAQVITYAKYSSQNRENATTTYQLKTTYYIPSQSTVSFSNATSYLDGSGKSYGYTTMYRGETTIQEVSRTINHNQDGSSPIKNVATSWTASFGGSGSTSADIIFPEIQRYAIATNGTNFTDETNPTLTFSNVGLYGLRAKLLVGATEIYSENLSSQSATSYTYELTSSQRNQLRQLCTGKTIEVTLSICSLENNSIIYTSSVNVIMSIVNAEPTFTYTVLETNEDVIDFLNSSSAQEIVDNVSNLSFSVSPTSYKNATISGVSITAGGLTYTNTISPYEITIPVTDNIFTISVIDSRGYTTTQIDSNRVLLNYEPLKINNFLFKRESSTSSNIILNADILYYSEIGNDNNSVNVKWKLDDGSYNTIPSSNYIIDTTNNKLTISNYELTNALVHTSQGQFTIYVEDLFTETQDSGDNGLVLKGIPTFDAGEHDFKVNGKLYVADENGNNKVPVMTQTAPIIDTNGWIVIDNPTMPYIEYYKNGTVNIRMAMVGITWQVYNVSDLPTGITFDDDIYVTGSVESWDPALIPSISPHTDNKIKVIAAWLYTGSIWNANHKWYVKIIKFR